MRKSKTYEDYTFNRDDTYLIDHDDLILPHFLF